MVAPPVEKPVEVLTKAAPASSDNSQPFTFSSSVKRQVSIMTLTIEGVEYAMTFSL